MLVSHGDGGDIKGGRYDPGHNTWAPMSTNNAPLQRANHTAVWTGKRFIVWGGFGRLRTTGSAGYLWDGGIYNPETDTWKLTSTEEAPLGRAYHVAVWTGSEMIVWGGSDPDRLGDGARYNLETDTWTSIATSNAPSRRANARAVWTGSEMIVWGGDGDSHAGGRYDPKTDSWKSMSVLGAPLSGLYFVCLWTGTEMIVWGELTGGGARYNPITDTWRAMNTNGSPPVRAYSSGVWTGHEMIVWGGQSAPAVLYNDGARYNPVTDIWIGTTIEGAPTPRETEAAVWIGDAMLCFGGWTGENFHVNDLWSYQPGDVFSGDGLPDEWQRTFFGNTPTENALLLSDVDADGQPNYFECVTGTNPTNSASRFSLHLGLDTGLRPQLRLSGLSFDRNVSVQWTTNVESQIFQPLTTFQVETQSQSIVITDSAALPGARFYQVRIERPSTEY